MQHLARAGDTDAPGVIQKPGRTPKLGMLWTTSTNATDPRASRRAAYAPASHGLSRASADVDGNRFARALLVPPAWPCIHFATSIPAASWARPESRGCGPSRLQSPPGPAEADAEARNSRKAGGAWTAFPRPSAVTSSAAPRVALAHAERRPLSARLTGCSCGRVEVPRHHLSGPRRPIYAGSGSSLSQ